MTIGTILGVFLLVVAAFISYMESISYFDAFYACFITYSTIGFGDIDIYVIVETATQTEQNISMSFLSMQRISYRSNWFNLMIYGNCVHLAGYMMVSAWIAALLYKFGVKKNKCDNLVEVLMSKDPVKNKRGGVIRAQATNNSKPSQ